MNRETKIKYLGQCGFLISSGNTSIVTDPHLSYILEKEKYSEETPWKRLYAPPCTLANLSPDIILISHGHDDHLDPYTLKEYITSGANAYFIAPAPICHILSELGVSDSKIIRAHEEKEIFLKDCSILPIACAHTEFHRDEKGDLFELSYFIKIGSASIFFGGDMSLYDTLIERISDKKPDLLLLPCNGRDEERTAKGIIGNITEIEAACLAAELGVPFVPMHHDLYKINGCSEERIVRAAKKAGAEIILPSEL